MVETGIIIQLINNNTLAKTEQQIKGSIEKKIHTLKVNKRFNHHTLI